MGYLENDSALYSYIHDYHLATLDDNRIFFEKLDFDEIYNFLKKFKPHYYYFRGIENYLIPKISTETELKAVCSMFLSDEAWPPLTVKYLELTDNLRKTNNFEYTGILWMQDKLPLLPKKNFSKNNSFNFKLKLSKLSTEIDFLNFFIFCGNEESMEEVAKAWYKRFIGRKIEERNKKRRIIVQTQEEKNKLIKKSKEEVQKIIRETRDENIRLIALLVLKELKTNPTKFLDLPESTKTVHEYHYAS